MFNLTHMSERDAFQYFHRCAEAGFYSAAILWWERRCPFWSLDDNMNRAGTSDAWYTLLPQYDDNGWEKVEA